MKRPGPTSRRSRRADEAGKGQRRSGVKSAFPNAGWLASNSLRFFRANEVPNAQCKFGGLGARLTELSVAQNTEAVSRRAKAPNSARAHLFRERGYLDGLRVRRVRLSRVALGHVQTIDATGDKNVKARCRRRGANDTERANGTDRRRAPTIRIQKSKARLRENPGVLGRTTYKAPKTRSNYMRTSGSLRFKG